MTIPQEWPQSVVKLAKAIAQAEGFGPPKAIPTLGNNPGDLTGSDAGTFATLGVMNAEGVVRFTNLADGWTALYIKCNRMLSGKSLIYPLTLTLAQVGMKYSGGNPAWSRNVAAALGVPETTTLAQLAAEIVQ